MKKTYIDEEAIAANIQALRRLRRTGNDLIEYWGRLIKNQQPTTADYRAWAGNPDYIYERYREINLKAMTPEVFDHLPPETQRPPLDDPPEVRNPLAGLHVTRQGPDGTHRSHPGPSKFTPGRYAKTARLAGMPGRTSDTKAIIVSPEWLELKNGEVVISKDAEKRLTEHFTHTFTDEQLAVGNEMEGMLSSIEKVFKITGGKLPITMKAGRPELDINQLKRMT